MEQPYELPGRTSASEVLGHTEVRPFKPLTYIDVAEILDCSERHVRDLIATGELIAPRKLGGKAMWHPNVFWNWLDAFLRETHVATEGTTTKATRSARVRHPFAVRERCKTHSPALRRAEAMILAPLEGGAESETIELRDARPAALEAQSTASDQPARILH